MFFACDQSTHPPLAEERAATDIDRSGNQGSHDPVNAGYISNLSAINTWKRLNERDRYAWAGQRDFRIPDWAFKAYGSDIRKGIMNPIQGGDIDRDGLYNDFALIVVDRNRTELERFALVIFNERPDGEYDVHWLFRNTDLSRYVMDWSSDGLGISDFKEDGSLLYCKVNWDAENRSYVCNMHVPGF